MFVETVMGSSYLLKSEAEMSLIWNRNLTKLHFMMFYFLKLLNCSVGLVGYAKDPDVSILPPLNKCSCTFEHTISRSWSVLVSLKAIRWEPLCLLQKLQSPKSTNSYRGFFAHLNIDIQIIQLFSNNRCRSYSSFDKV